MCVDAGGVARFAVLLVYRLELLFVDQAGMVCCRSDRKHGDCFSMRPPEHPRDRCRSDRKERQQANKRLSCSKKERSCAHHNSNTSTAGSLCCRREVVQPTEQRWSLFTLPPKNASGKTPRPTPDREDFSLVDAPLRRTLGAAGQELVGAFD